MFVIKKYEVRLDTLSDEEFEILYNRATEWFTQNQKVDASSRREEVVADFIVTEFQVGNFTNMVDEYVPTFAPSAGL